MDRQNLSGSGCNYAKQEFNTCCVRGSRGEESKVLLAVWSPVSNRTFPWMKDWVKAIFVPSGNTWKFLHLLPVCHKSCDILLQCQHKVPELNLLRLFILFLQAQAAKQHCNFSPFIFSRVGVC